MGEIGDARETATARLITMAARYERAAKQLRAVAEFAKGLTPGSVEEEGLFLLSLGLRVP